MKNLTVQKGAFINPTALQQIEHLSSKLIKSQALPNTIRNAEQLYMVLLAGYDAGMTPIEAINSYYIVNGKVTIWGAAVITQLKRAGWKVNWKERSATKVTVEISKGDDVGEASFTIEEAEKAGLTGKGPWLKYPQDMLCWKAIGRAIRFTCPDVLSGVYIKEDIESDIETTATVVQAEVKEVQEEEPPQAGLDVASDEQKARINALIDQIDAPREKIEEWIVMQSGGSVDDLTIGYADAIEKQLQARVEAAQETSEDEEESDDDSSQPEPAEDEVIDVEPAQSVDEIVENLPPDMGGPEEPEVVDAKSAILNSMPPEQRKTFERMGAASK